MKSQALKVDQPSRMLKNKFQQLVYVTLSITMFVGLTILHGIFPDISYI